MLEFLIWITLGTIFGVIAGLVPGIHPNLAIILMTSIAASLGLEPLNVAIFLVAAGVVNSFVDYIPSVFLGAPEEATALSVLPGHRLLMQGRAYEAIKLTVIGGFGSIILSIMLLPIFVFTIPKIYLFIKPFLHWILVFVISYMIFSEIGFKKMLWALFVFSIAGILGYISLNMITGNMIFPLLSGLFGLPILLLAIKEKTSLPDKMEMETTNIGRKNTLIGIITGTLSGIIVGLLPGVGAAQATILAQEASGKAKQEIADRQFLIATGCVNTANMIFSLLALFLIGKGRSGLAVAIGEIIEIGINNIFIFLSIILISCGIGTILTLKLSKTFMIVIKKVNYQKLCISIFCLICILVGIFTGFIGLFVCGVSLAVGLIPNLVGVKKSHAMGCLMLPVILFFFGF